MVVTPKRPKPYFAANLLEAMPSNGFRNNWAQLLEVHGRKAKLTKAGEVLLRASRQLLKDTIGIEELAANLKRGREAEIHVVVEAAFPTNVLIHGHQ